MRLDDVKKVMDGVFDDINKVIIGQKEMLQQVVICLLANGHALIEGYPGLAKTLAVRTISQLLDLRFSRVQHTPDLMPSDIIGTYLLDESSGKRIFKFQPGPIFANVVLADEINRSTPKTQSALLEAMQERQVTAGNTTFKLEEPFFVLATQNPIEQEGTYPLPEAQSDRFLLKIQVQYPTYDEELEIVNRYAEDKKKVELKPVLGKNDVLQLQSFAQQVPIANDLKRYAVEVVNRSRQKKDLIEYGASPRASLAMVAAAKARALIQGRKYVSREDIQAMAYPVLRHRMILSFDAERQDLHTDDVIKMLLK
jgi:MoxR-like ATPase